MTARLIPVLMSILGGGFMASSYADDNATAASLLTAADDDGWSLEAMVANRPVNKEADGVREKSEFKVLTKKSAGSGQMAENKSHHHRAQLPKVVLNRSGKEFNEAKKTRVVPDSENKVYTKQSMEYLLDLLRHKSLEQKSASEQSVRDLAKLRADLARKTEQVEALRTQTNESRAELSRLQASALKKEKIVQDMNSALIMRSRELKEAATALASLRGKQKHIVPSTPEQKQAYVAGLMMADSLNHRLESWIQAGVKTDMNLFSSGLEDGLRHKPQLKASEAQRIQSAFMKDVQAGVARKVLEAQTMLRTQAKGRNALKSENGITWYRVHAGKPVKNNQPVRLSMTEQVMGGKMISKVPALTLHPNDEIPSIIKDGMYLPGEQGEVVAYALAQNVYKGLPLPSGVQPWTVMEYHLKGVPLTARSG